MKTYNVQITPKFPAWDERGGWIVEIVARSKADAIKYARAQTRRDGHMGIIYFRAEEVRTLEEP